jgi:glucose-6-phosphate dehydrogenase assembly protein OpcA
MARLPKMKLRKTRNPGDYEAELIRLCRGNRREAERLILEEQQKSPELSRQGAALALVTRIRHEREPRRRPL